MRQNHAFEEHLRLCSSPMLIACDIGGTKTDLAIYPPESGLHTPLAQTQLHSLDYPSSQLMVTTFFPDAKVSIDVASFGLVESFLTRDGSQYLARGSEGGHSNFAPTDERRPRLLHLSSSFWRSRSRARLPSKSVSVIFMTFYITNNCCKKRSAMLLRRFDAANADSPHHDRRTPSSSNYVRTAGHERGQKPRGSTYFLAAVQLARRDEIEEMKRRSEWQRVLNLK